MIVLLLIVGGLALAGIVGSVVAIARERARLSAVRRP
jgi:hypothetical protein